MLLVGQNKRKYRREINHLLGQLANDLEEAGFEEFKVNHRYNFGDIDTGGHTQMVKWGDRPNGATNVIKEQHTIT